MFPARKWAFASRRCDWRSIKQIHLPLVNMPRLSSNQANKRVMIEHMSAMITEGQGCSRISRNRRALDMPRAQISVPADWGERWGKIWCKYVTPEHTFERIKKLIWMMKIYWFFHGVLASVLLDGHPRNMRGCEHVCSGGIDGAHTLLHFRFTSAYLRALKPLHKL